MYGCGPHCGGQCVGDLPGWLAGPGVEGGRGVLWSGALYGRVGFRRDFLLFLYEVGFSGVFGIRYSVQDFISPRCF